MANLDFFREFFGICEMPAEPCPPAPPHHVDSDACTYGWIACPEDEPIWLPCDCEDPADPWPPRPPEAGPRDCPCSGCSGRPRRERGMGAWCEMWDHCCPNCHEREICTQAACLDEKIR